MSITDSTSGRGVLLNTPTTQSTRPGSREDKHKVGEGPQTPRPSPVSTPRDRAIDDLQADLVRGASEQSLVLFRSILNHVQHEVHESRGRTNLGDGETRGRMISGLGGLFDQLRAENASLTSDGFLAALQLVFNPTTVALGSRADMDNFLNDLQGALRQIETASS